jgi:hypothetical protein
MRLVSLIVTLTLASFAGATHPQFVVRQRIVQPYVSQVVVQPVVQAVYAQPVVQQVQFQHYAQPVVQQVVAQPYFQQVQAVQVQAFSNHHAVAVQPVVVRQVQHRSRGGFFGRLFR